MPAVEAAERKGVRIEGAEQRTKAGSMRAAGAAWMNEKVARGVQREKERESETAAGGREETARLQLRLIQQAT